MVKAHPIPSTQPYLNHDTLTQDQQARHLGVKQETVMNLGHPYPVSRLTENPAAVVDYTNNDVGKKMLRQSRSVGVYEKFRDPKDGTPNQQNLDRWSDYARSNSYHGKDGKDAPMRDGGRSSVPSAAREKDSDGYLPARRIGVRTSTVPRRVWAGSRNRESIEIEPWHGASTAGAMQ
jgi:hypothetical protein